MKEDNGLEVCLPAISKAIWSDEKGGKTKRELKKMTNSEKGFYRSCFLCLL